MTARKKSAVTARKKPTATVACAACGALWLDPQDNYCYGCEHVVCQDCVEHSFYGTPFPDGSHTLEDHKR